MAAKKPEGTDKGTDKRLANLRPAWKPGESGNPAGMKPGTVSLVSLLKAKLAECPPGTERTNAQILVEATFRDALKGDAQARKLCWAYIEGDPKQTVEVSGGIEHYTYTELDIEIRRLCETLGYGEAPSLPAPKARARRALPAGKRD